MILHGRGHCLMVLKLKFLNKVCYVIFVIPLRLLTVTAVLLQVESQVADFRKDLMKKLYALPSTLADQKKTIKLGILPTKI